ncbi:MAG: hypothetical protein ACI9CF_001210 [Candidatus Omnitrophota bacterium]|jgi:hypothetical protein
MRNKIIYILLISIYSCGFALANEAEFAKVIHLDSLAESAFEGKHTRLAIDKEIRPKSIIKTGPGSMVIVALDPDMQRVVFVGQYSKVYLESLNPPKLYLVQGNAMTLSNGKVDELLEVSTTSLIAKSNVGSMDVTHKGQTSRLAIVDRGGFVHSLKPNKRPLNNTPHQMGPGKTVLIGGDHQPPLKFADTDEKQNNFYLRKLKFIKSTIDAYQIKNPKESKESKEV